jgi:hypothetical protein
MRHNSMKRNRKLLSCLLLLIVFLIPTANLVFALAPLSAGTFPSGTIVVPMDDKQADRVHVYGFVHEFLRTVPGATVARVIETPDVTMQTALTPNGTLYQGGPFLIDASFLSALTTLHNLKIFSQVTYTTLTTAFTSNRIFFIRQPTRILVISDGYWGKTFLTLTRMGINFTQVTTDQIMADPSLINQYSLIVLDSPGWYGVPQKYSSLKNQEIVAVYNTIQARVKAGNEVMYTDAALLDLNATFPGYMVMGNIGESGSWQSIMHSPAKGGFDSEFPSQYYGTGPTPNNIRIFTEEGAGYWVPIAVQAAHVRDVRVLIDTTNYGIPTIPYAILAFYFPYGNGIVEGLALQPYQQLYPTYADYNGYYAVYQIYGNKFVEGPQNDFVLSATPSIQAVPQTQSATYQIAATSIGSFASTVNLSVTGLPVGTHAIFTPSASVALSQGQSVTETLNILTSSSTPLGNYSLTVTGSSSLPLITRSISIGLVVLARPADFIISATPSTLILSQGACENATVTVTSIGSFNSPVNLTLSGLPGQVTSRLVPNPITPAPGGAVSSVLTFCAASSSSPGNYTLIVTGTSGTTVHTVNILLQIPSPVYPPISSLIFWIILGMLLLALGSGLLAFLLSGKSGRRRGAAVGPVLAPSPVAVAPPGPRLRYVLPMPTVRCRYCGRVIPLNAVYCPHCGRPNVAITAPTRFVGARRAGGRKVIPAVLALLSGVLVILNTAALLSPPFYSSWTGIFFWIPTLGPTYAFMLGGLIGVTLILGAIIMAVGNGPLADVIVFPFTIFSLIIGGGFIAGMILGIVGGILALRR